MYRRWLLVGIVVLAAAQCGFWLIGAWSAWSVGSWLSSLQFAIALSIGAGLNVLALLAFLIRRWEWGRVLLPAVQVGNVLFALVASATVSPAWLLLGAAPAVATLLLILLRRKANATRSAASL
jgi:hypothetical protein